MAWKYNRDHHLIKLRKDLPAEMLFHHVLAHEYHHILIEATLRKAGRNRWFVSTDDGAAAAVASCSGEIRRISRRTGHDRDGLEQMLRRMFPDMLSLVYNGALDMVIEARLHDDPRLRDAQFCSLNLQVHNAARVGFHKESRSIVPAAFLRVNDVYNGANALFLDRLHHGATDYFAPYAEMPSAKFAVQVCDLCASWSGADEHDLVDQCAELLGLKDWYSWRPDPGDFPVLETLKGNPKEGLSDVSKLKQKSAAAVQLLARAMDRFEKLGPYKTKALVAEAAMAGQSGVNFSDPEPTHSLASLPGEKLSGLELMCILYAGLKKFSPDMPDSEIGMDLAEEYRTALEMRGDVG